MIASRDTSLNEVYMKVSILQLICVIIYIYIIVSYIYCYF